MTPHGTDLGIPHWIWCEATGPETFITCSRLTFQQKKGIIYFVVEGVRGGAGGSFIRLVVNFPGVAERQKFARSDSLQDATAYPTHFRELAVERTFSS
ncbi:Hypothetical protein PP7435_CHR4-0172 [Komagataella phaffii CBS 7435]|uniref:Uncharacterized protein n=1 Tax=Komagataella phaffii (strain ATCC 76273 / CBS 7435 / CECT 11047 / NRRL Y-11430 / Wegner 21-1) TaxID=981350 RepID=F2QY69_KOMPC|nr:Hypothetical protein PP7435_CHR4-0172 [Komagataella phaffii CBS 7435]